MNSIELSEMEVDYIVASAKERTRVMHEAREAIARADSRYNNALRLVFKQHNVEFPKSSETQINVSVDDETGLPFALEWEEEIKKDLNDSCVDGRDS